MAPYAGTPADLKRTADRGRQATRPLKIDDQEYGHELVRMLEAHAGQTSRVSEDPREERYSPCSSRW